MGSLMGLRELGAAEGLRLLGTLVGDATVSAVEGLKEEPKEGGKDGSSVGMTDECSVFR